MDVRDSAMSSVDGGYPVSEPIKKERRLSGNMGAVGLALTVLAFSAPLTVMYGYLPFALAFGSVGTPLAYAVVAIILLLFSVGYVTLNGIVKRPGDFYAFISFGIGKSFGLGSGLLAAVSYFLILAGTTSFFGVQCADIQRQIAGHAYPWYVYSLGVWLLVSWLGYLHVEMSAKVLSYAMIVEVVVCLVFSVGIIAKGGDASLPAAAPFSPIELFKHAPAFCMLFAVSNYGGFEATALFRDEVKTPDRTIPVATYGAVIFIGVLYTLGSYAMVRAFGTSVAAVANASPDTMFSAAFARFVSARFQTVISMLVLCSAFASILSTHNVLSRYLHNLGTDGALPRFLDKVHERHESPYLASITVSVMVLAVLTPFMIAGAKPEILYGQLAGVSAAGVIVLMTVVNFSSLIWYMRAGKNENTNFIKSFVCPAISSVFFLILVYVIAMHFELLAGGEPGQYVWMLYTVLSVQLLGMVLAQYFKAYRPKVYARLGRSHGEAASL